jgi:branched-chain amino acid aminotransferase
VESTRIYRAEIPYSLEQLTSAALETIRINKLKSCYIRPLVYRGYGEMGLNPLGCPVETAIAVWEWGKYLGQESIEQGIDVCVSSWNRAAPNTFPTMAKVGANYMNSQLIKLEALANGYAEGIALDTFGYISEGSGENIFIVKSGIIYTTPLISAILQGITRDAVITLAGELGYEVREMQIPREMLYIADEIFFTGTATEIVPIRTVDRLTVGSGKRGDITQSLQRAFYSIVENGIDTHNWLTFVY